MGGGDSLTAGLQQVFACSPEAAARLGARATDRRFPAEAALLREADPCRSVFVLLSGRARAQLNGVEGQLAILGEFGAGDLFGALEDGGASPFGADVVALEPCRAAVIGAADFATLAREDGAVATSALRILARQVCAGRQRLAERVTLSAPGRVHAALLRMACDRRVEPWPSPTVLAPQVQSTRETVSRTLHALERRGIVRRDGGALVIVAPRRLEELVL
jgi:CRP-like cAMP-binding protein